MAYKDGTQVRHIRSSSHQPVNIVSFHNHLHKSDINEVIKGSLWVLFQWRSLVLPRLNYHQVIVKALKTLEAERKCEIFDEMDGVKFF